jgi:predicted DNA-binding transcriptional regulator AlpA
MRRRSFDYLNVRRLPKNFPISKQSRAWDSEGVDAWIASKIAARSMEAG